MFYFDPDRLNADALALDAQLALAAADARTEEDFRISAVTALRQVGTNAGLHFDVRPEMAIAAGRADATFISNRH